MVKVSKEENRHVMRRKLALYFVVPIKACDEWCLIFKLFRLSWAWDIAIKAISSTCQIQRYHRKP